MPMLQIKCPHCQHMMTMNAMPAQGRVACPSCGQQLILQQPAKPVPPPAARTVAPRQPEVVDDAIDLRTGLTAAPRANVVQGAMPGQGSTIRPGQPARPARAPQVAEPAERP